MFFGPVFLHRQAVERFLFFDQPAFHLVDQVDALCHGCGQRFGFGLEVLPLGFFLFEFRVVPILVPDELPQAQQVDVPVKLEYPVLEFAIGDGFVGLPLEAVVRVLYLREDGLDLPHVFFGSDELGLGFPHPDLMLGYSRRFFEEIAPVLGFRGEYLVDLALLHNRIRGLADARVPEQLPHFLELGQAAVDVVFALP